jgi:hypothetical protein
MAMITSRGFEGLGRDNVDAMIPLLDMLNHIRGPTFVGEGNVGGTGYDRDATSDEKLVEPSRPDVHYKREDDDNAGGEAYGRDHIPSKRQKTAKSSDVFKGGGGVGGGVLVYTSRCLSSGSTLRMTYGAKGNVTLLGRYGFAILNNVEPDGSCNDLLEIEIKENEYHVQLRKEVPSHTRTGHSSELWNYVMTVRARTLQERVLRIAPQLTMDLTTSWNLAMTKVGSTKMLILVKTIVLVEKISVILSTKYLQNLMAHKLVNQLEC